MRLPIVLLLLLLPTLTFAQEHRYKIKKGLQPVERVAKERSDTTGVREVRTKEPPAPRPAEAPAAPAQEEPLQESRHGWYLSPHGTIRVLLIFAEIEYDVNPGNDPQPDGVEHWPKGKLPVWKDEVFDPHPLDLPQAMVTRYYHDISLGQYTVLGDYIDQLITIRESEHANIRQAHGLSKIAVTEVNKMERFRTRHGLSIADFDMWQRGGKAGKPKIPGPDDPHSFDHVMVILRNSGLTHGQGSVDPGTPGELFGHKADSQSRFGGMNALPFEILKHEFNHLLLGGNNMHSGGGNAAQFLSHFISLQGGWSMMGAGGSSLLTCAAWDRYRLGWRTPGSEFDIVARDGSGRPVNGDIDPIAGDTGLFVLGDMVTAGEALRIKIPFISGDRDQQWLWIENHQGHQRNGSPTDKFHWEGNGPCIAPIEPGLFMMMQVAREERVGKNIFNGHADYLRALPANGMFDLELRGDTIFNTCPFGGNSIPVIVSDRNMNPLTGNHEQELPVFDHNKDGVLESGAHYVPGTRIRNGRPEAEMIFFGRPEHAFRMNGKRKIGMGTNPSTANMMTLVNARGKDHYNGGAPNVRSIHLNGISVEMLEMDASGDITIRVRANDVRLTEDVRWCADTIFLPPLQGEGGRSLIVEVGVELMLDRSATPTRINAPESYKGRTWFSSPTRFIAEKGAVIEFKDGSALELRNGSEIHLMPGSELIFSPKAKLKMDKDSRIVYHTMPSAESGNKHLKKMIRKGRVVLPSDQ